MYNVTEYDLRLLSQKTKKCYSRIILYNDKGKTMGEIIGVVTDGSWTVDADSMVRRTCSLETILDKKSTDLFTEKEYFTYFVKVELGYYSILKKEIIYYNLGKYGFDSKSHSYNATSNTLSLSLIDKMGMLDASHRGILYGGKTYKFPVMNEDSGNRIGRIFNTNGDIIGSTNTIKNTIVTVLKQAGIEDYDIQEIGVYSVIRGRQTEEEYFNSSGSTSIKSITDSEGNITTHINDNRHWYNELPYELTFDLGSDIQNELSTLKDLYPNYECYFDLDGKFHCGMIPSCTKDYVYLSDKDFTPYVISESYSTNIYDVKNIIEVWGMENSVDNYSSMPDFLKKNDTSAVEQNIKITLSNFKCKSDDTSNPYVYADGLVVAIKFKDYPEVQCNKLTLQIIASNDKENSDEKEVIEYPVAPIYDSLTSDFIPTDRFSTDTTYLFQWSANKNGWYFLGEYQVHALAVLSEKTDDAEINQLKKDMATKFNCSVNAVEIMSNPDSPYCIEKIGEIVAVKSDSDYANITNDSLAMDKARDDLWRSTRRQDSISLETITIPFLDVNVKVEYTKQGEERPCEYIVKKINGKLKGGTMSVELMRFYPLYEEDY